MIYCKWIPYLYSGAKFGLDFLGFVEKITKKNKPRLIFVASATWIASFYPLFGFRPCVILSFNNPSLSRDPTTNSGFADSQSIKVGIHSAGAFDDGGGNVGTSTLTSFRFFLSISESEGPETAPTLGIRTHTPAPPALFNLTWHPRLVSFFVTAGCFHG